MTTRTKTSPDHLAPPAASSRAAAITAACRAIAKYNRHRDGWERSHDRLTMRAACDAEGADREDVAEVRAVLMRLGIDPRRQYDAGAIRALVLTDAIADDDDPTPVQIESWHDFTDPLRRRCE